MKKILSVLLALALGMSLAVCAAAKSDPPAKDPGVQEAKAVTQGLFATLPNVTGVAARWAGPALSLEWPDIGPDTVEITLSFAVGAPVTLPYWDDEASDGWWQIREELVGKTAAALTLRYYYEDEKLWDAYINTLASPWWDNYNEAAYLATLKSATVTVPLNTVEEFIDSHRPLTALALDVSQAVALAAGAYRVFSFTPGADGAYCFYSFDNSGDPYGYLVGPDFKIMRRNDDGMGDLNFRMAVDLKKDTTYYLVASTYMQRAGSYKVMVTETDRADFFGFWLWNTQYDIRYRTYEYVDAWQFIGQNDYEYGGVLVNGIPLWNAEFRVEGAKPGKIMTLTYTLADGTLLGTVDIVCKMSCSQWILYYLLFGWLWMPRVEIISVYDMPRFSLTADGANGFLKILWGMLLYGRAK